MINVCVNRNNHCVDITKYTNKWVHKMPKNSSDSTAAPRRWCQTEGELFCSLAEGTKHIVNH